jgi:hypothetical protein
MKLTRGEFCQFSLRARFELLTEYGKNVMKKKIGMKMISVYRVFDFYVEVYVNLISLQLEKVEPVRNNSIVEAYESL